MIYFDCASTTKPYDEALDTFVSVSRDHFANASANHTLGNDADSYLTKARNQVARYLSVDPEEVIFDSGASEGNNFAIKGVAYHNHSWADKIITTKGEHPSVLEVFHALEKEGFRVVYIGYDKDGNLDFDALEKELDSKTSLVSVMAVNNEVGYCFDTKKVYAMVHKLSRAVLHVDGTQAIGKLPLDPEYYDLMTFSGHKIGSVKGSGVLVKKKKVQIDPLIDGGGQEFGLRSGTETVPEDCTLATALRLTMKSMPERSENAKKLNDYLRTELSKIEEVVITTPKNGSPFLLNFALLKHKGSVIAEALSSKGVYVSTKSACSAHQPGKSYVLSAAGYDDVISSNSIRLSFSGREDIKQGEQFIGILKSLLCTIKERS